MSINSTDPIDQLLTLLDNPRVRDFLDKIIEAAVEKKIKESYETQKFKASVEETILTSECQPIKRIAKLEEITGLVDFSDFFEEEDHEPTIPERIQYLEEKLTNFEERPTASPQVEFKPETKTGIRAMHLITKLKASGKDHLTHKEIKSILTGDLPEDCRIDTKSKNPRKTIIDVLNEAASICSDVFLDQKKKGHREWRIALKS